MCYTVFETLFIVVATIVIYSMVLLCYRKRRIESEEPLLDNPYQQL